ncbi:MAG TPA: VWA domain-containing protein [Pyrinomonadaceae bacterium]|jgi:VWFA-related protein|nr:VWA domain-containing protein [Pyrinomonadaceae bacterium]
MKKLAALALLLPLYAVSLAPAATAQTRARRVGAGGGGGAPTVAAPRTNEPAGSDEPAPTRRPPTLGGAIATNDARPAGQRPPQSDEPVDVDEDEVLSVNTTLVTLPVSVTDRYGKYIPDLRKEDFRVYEDGVEQQVAYFATVEKPFTVALVIDTSASTRYRIEEIQDAAISFVDQLRPEDRVMVVSFDEDVRVLAEPTSDRRALREAIRRARTGGNTRLYDAMDFVINSRLSRIEGRKAVVLFTDGVDTASRHATYQSTVRDAEEIDALIYPVQYDTSGYAGGNNGGGFPYPGGGGGSRRGGGGSRRGGTGGTIADILGSVIFGGVVTIGNGGGGGYPGGGGGSTTCAGCSRSDYERADRYLEDLARMTGARRYDAEAQRDLSAAFALVAEELRRQYSLGYYPKLTPRAGERRHVKVRVMRPDLAVQTRDTYVFGESKADTAQHTGQQQQQRTRPTIKSQPFDTAAPQLQR